VDSGKLESCGKNCTIFQLDVASKDKERFSNLDIQIIRDSVERQRDELEQLLKRFPQYSR
jgi:hypothetical protein